MLSAWFDLTVEDIAAALDYCSRRLERLRAAGRPVQRGQSSRARRSPWRSRTNGSRGAGVGSRWPATWGSARCCLRRHHPWLPERGASDGRDLGPASRTPGSAWTSSHVERVARRRAEDRATSAPSAARRGRSLQGKRDDPPLFAVGILDEYELCRDRLGLTEIRLAAVPRVWVMTSAAPPR